MEYKFRAWDAKGKEMIYLENSGLQCFDFEGNYSLGFTVDGYSGFWAHEQYDRRTKESSSFPIMPCVGLKDKNGKEAYVGNIYQETLLDGTRRLYKIFNVKGGFAINTFSDDFYKSPEKIVYYSGLSDMQVVSWLESCLEEIGNIYQNPELLENGSKN